LAAEADVEKLKAFNRARVNSQFFVLCGQPWLDKSFLDNGGEPRPEYTTCRLTTTGLEATREHWCRCPLCGRVDLFGPYQLSRDDEWAVYCFDCDSGASGWPCESDFTYFHKGDAVALRPELVFPEQLFAAYAAARSARFEHGESPRANGRGPGTNHHTAGP
jgi:hypothetical protein